MHITAVWFVAVHVVQADVDISHRPTGHPSSYTQRAHIIFSPLFHVQFFVLLFFFYDILWYFYGIHDPRRHNDTTTQQPRRQTKKTLRIRTNYKCFGFHSCHKPKMNGQTNMLVINIGSSFIFSRPAWPVMEACEKRRRRIDERIRSILPFAMRPLVCTEHSGSWSVCFSKVICDGEFDLGKWRVRFIVWNRRMASMGPG